MRYLFRTSKYYHLYFSKLGQDIAPWPFFLSFPGIRPEIKTGLNAPTPQFIYKKKQKNRAGIREDTMDHTFVNKTIVAFNELISSVDENSVTTTGMGDAGDIVILLGAASPNQLAAMVLLGSYPFLMLSGDNPRDVAERLSNAIEKFDQIGKQAMETNAQFGEDFERAMTVAFNRTIDDSFSKSE